jgi:hypothetical protein
MTATSVLSRATRERGRMKRRAVQVKGAEWLFSRPMPPSADDCRPILPAMSLCFVQLRAFVVMFTTKVRRTLSIHDLLVRGRTGPARVDAGAGRVRLPRALVSTRSAAAPAPACAPRGDSVFIPRAGGGRRAIRNHGERFATE